MLRIKKTVLKIIEIVTLLLKVIKRRINFNSVIVRIAPSALYNNTL